MKTQKILIGDLSPGDRFYMSNSKGEKARCIYTLIKFYDYRDWYGSRKKMKVKSEKSSQSDYLYVVYQGPYSFVHKIVE